MGPYERGRGVAPAEQRDPAVRHIFRQHGNRGEAQLPASFAEAIRHLPIDDSRVGTCGQAVFTGEPVACESIATDTTWSQSWRWHCLEHGVQACHSEPIRGRSGQTIASLMLCFSSRESSTPGSRTSRSSAAPWRASPSSTSAATARCARARRDSTGWPT